MIVTTSNAIEKALQSFSPIERRFIGSVLSRADVATLGGQEYETYLQTLYDDTLSTCWSDVAYDWDNECVNDAYEEYDYDEIWQLFLRTLKDEEDTFVKQVAS